MSRSLLQNVYLFKSMRAEDVDGLSEICEAKILNTGETVFIRGESAKALYLIKRGSIKIQQSTKSGDNLDVTILATGSHFGEMAFVDGEPRSATAVAAESTEVLVLPYDKLNLYLSKNKDAAVIFYRELAHFLCGRLRVTTNDLSFSREKNLTHF